jgi:hypothetical protein
LTPAHVTDFVRDHLTADNAVLVSTGEPPNHPGITLHTGRRPPRQPVVVSSTALPAYLAGPPVPIVSWLTERTPAAQLLHLLVTDLLTDELRHGEGIVYEIGCGTTPLSRDATLAGLWADGAESDQPRILTRAVELLGRIASKGPDPADLDHQKALARNQMGDPRGTYAFLVDAAHRRLEGRPVTGVEEAISEIEAVTAEQVRAAASAALPTLLLGGSEPAPAGGIAGIPDRTDDRLPECPAFEGRRWKRRLVSMAPRDLRLDMNDEGLAQTVYGFRGGGLWSDVVGVAQGPDFRAVVFRDGGQLVVWPSSLKDGDAAVAEIDRRAGDLLFEVDEEWL